MDEYERKTHELLIKTACRIAVLFAVACAFVLIGSSELIDQFVPLIKLLFFYP